jgi:hypothetical protein
MTHSVLATIGLYQDGVMKKDVDGKDTVGKWKFLSYYFEILIDLPRTCSTHLRIHYPIINVVETCSCRTDAKRSQQSRSRSDDLLSETEEYEEDQ